MKADASRDYDRLQFSPVETQQQYFRKRPHRLEPELTETCVIGIQLGLAKKYSLPLFLHSRNAHADLVRILREEGFGVDGGRAVGGRGGVIHSFTGLKEEVTELVSAVRASSTGPGR